MLLPPVIVEPTSQHAIKGCFERAHSLRLSTLGRVCEAPFQTRIRKLSLGNRNRPNLGIVSNNHHAHHHHPFFQIYEMMAPPADGQYR